MPFRPQLILCSVFVAGCSLAHVSLAEEPARLVETYGAWQLRCESREPEKVRICEIGQSIQIQGQAQPILQLAIGRIDRARPNNLVIRVPIAVWLPSGASFIVPGGKTVVEAQFKRCLPTACIAEAVVDDNIVALLRNADEAEIGKVIFRASEDRVTELPIALKGFRAAFDAMEAAATKR